MIELFYGIIAGIVTGLGMGGGTILILLLTLFTESNQHVIQATNLIFFIPSSIAAIIGNIKERNINYKLAIYISFFGVVGAVIGTIFSKNIESESLKKYFAIFIILIAFFELYKLFKENKKDKGGKE